MRIPLAKCLSAASARLSPIGVALASDAARDAAPTTEATLALHLLHELYVRADDSPWWVPEARARREDGEARCDMSRRSEP